MYELGSLLHSPGNVFESNGKGFGYVTADCHDAVAVHKIYPVIGHRAPSNRLDVGRHRSRDTYPGFILDVDQAQST